MGSSISGLRLILQQAGQMPVPDLLALLNRELSGLGDDALEAADRLDRLEILLPTLWLTLTAYEQLHLARTLPFTETDMGRWRVYIETWSLALAGYLQCLADADQGAAGMQGQQALLLQRIVRLATQVAVACFRAYQPVEPALWSLLHEHIERAEQGGSLDQQIPDTTLSQTPCGSVTDAWLQLLLLEFCDPYGFSPTQLMLASRWMEKLARIARLSREPVAHGNAGYAVVALDRSAGLTLLPEVPDIPEAGFPRHSKLRFVNLGPAREQIKRLLAKLRLGIAPEDLQLGADCTRDDAEMVLERIYRRWRTSRRRVHPRRNSDEPVRVAFGLAGVARYIDHLARGLAPDDVEGLGESRLVDQSPNGIGLIHGENGLRLRCQQLIALAGRRELLLGSVRWLSVDPRAGLRYGVRVISARPKVARIQTSATEVGTEEAALWLPDIPGIDEPVSLLVPPGTYFADRVLMLWIGDGEGEEIQLDRVLEVGSDFERVSFKPVR